MRCDSTAEARQGSDLLFRCVKGAIALHVAGEVALVVAPTRVFRHLDLAYARFRTLAFGLSFRHLGRKSFKAGGATFVARKHRRGGGRVMARANAEAARTGASGFSRADA